MGADSNEEGFEVRGKDEEIVGRTLLNCNIAGPTATYDQHPEADLNKRKPISPNNPNRERYLEKGGAI